MQVSNIILDLDDLKIKAKLIVHDLNHVIEAIDKRRHRLAYVMIKSILSYYKGGKIVFIKDAMEKNDWTKARKDAVFWRNYKQFQIENHY